MPNFVLGLLHGRNNLSSGLIALAIISVVALGCANNNNSNSKAGNESATAADKNPDMPDDAVLKANVKLTTAQFANAISTEDFSTLRNDASDEFKKKYTVEQAKDIFADAIKNKRALLPMLASLVKMDPDFSEPPSVRKEGDVPVVIVKGKYNTKPRPLEFEYEYVYLFGKMKLLKLILKQSEGGV